MQFHVLPSSLLPSSPSYPLPIPLLCLCLLLLFNRFLEEELARRYRDAAPATLALLQERCESVARELIAADKKLAEAGDVVSLRRTGGRTETVCRGGWEVVHSAVRTCLI